MKAHFWFRKIFSRVFLVLSLLLLCPAAGFSLDNERWSSGLNFHFYTPGARALAMGGAFVGLADDATAAASNPAGLAQLKRMQLAVEGRYAAQDKDTDSFRAADKYGYNAAWNTISDSTSAADVSFGAFTTPLFNSALTLSVFYDRPMDYSASKSSYTTRRQPLVTTSKTVSNSDISLDEAGISLATSIMDGKLMIGGGLAAQYFDISGLLNRSQLNTPGILTTERMDNTQAGMAYRVGILGKPFDKLRLGVSYTVMPEFDYSITRTSGNKTTYNTNFDVPDNISFGGSYNIFQNWVVLVEARYIMYSQLTDGFIAYNKLYYDKLPSKASQYSMDDIWEVHFGTEYVLNAIPNVPIALRGGIYYEPAHDLKYNGPADSIQGHLFDGGSDLVHYTFGTGAVFCDRYQMDVGADLTSQSQNVTLSMVYHF